MANLVAQITTKMTEMTTKSKQRRDRIATVTRLLGLTNTLVVEIKTLIGQMPNEQTHDNQLNGIIQALTQLETDLNATDAGNDRLIAQLLMNVRQLLEIRTKLSPGSSSPTVDEIQRLLQAQQRAGYKHSKTNSRKYVAKRFRSIRMSQPKRRRNKTLRMKRRRKL